MTGRRAWHGLGLVTAIALAATAVASQTETQHGGDRGGGDRFDERIVEHAVDLFTRGRQIFRFDTFGDERFWGGTLRLHEAIEGAPFGGVGPGAQPGRRARRRAEGRCRGAAAIGALHAITQGAIDLNDPAVTLALLDANAVVGLSARRERNGGLRSVGIQCALCHSTVDDSIAPGIGRGSTAGRIAT